MATSVDLNGLQTEGRNHNTAHIDQVSMAELCQIINSEDAAVTQAVSKCIPTIAAAIDVVADRVREGGRLIYIGAGTSGRLGVLDASEIPPTYSAPEGQFVALIAGGDGALRHAQEGAEDDVDAVVRDLRALRLDGAHDSLIGIAASGRTPYVLSGLAYAKSQGCVTVGLACVEPSAMSAGGHVDYQISPVVGPEVVTGSTRMKAGTATKLVLNTISTGVMIKTGKTLGNMMVDLRVTNLKLQQRARNILRNVCGPSCPDADDKLDALLRSCSGSVKLAIATVSLNVTVCEAQDRLDRAGGLLATLLHPTRSDQKINGTQDQADNLGSRFMLCIDGGGSKCAAAIVGETGNILYGESEACNVTDVGVDAALRSISYAVQRATDAHQTLHKRTWSPNLFASVWVALAGHDRKDLAASIDDALETLFHRSIGPNLAVTNDIELLAIAAAEQHAADAAVVLVAGTGSVAMAYMRRGNSFVRTGRVGGWGHLLGDDGSGYDIGRQAIRRLLFERDEYNNQAHDPSDLSAFTPSPLSRHILHHLHTEAGSDHGSELLSAVLSSSTGLEKKGVIARVARIVIELSDKDPDARLLVENAVQQLTSLLSTLVRSPSLHRLNSVLVFAGGLMQNKIMDGKMREALRKVPFTFQHVVTVSQPAVTGAQELLRRWKQDTQAPTRT